MRERGELRVVRFIIIPEDHMAFRVLIVIRVQYLSEVGVNVLEDMKLRPVDHPCDESRVAFVQARVQTSYSNVEY